MNSLYDNVSEVMPAKKTGAKLGGDQVVWVYRLGCFLMRLIFAITLRVRHRHLERLDRAGGYILACSHVSHLDPFCLAAISPRCIGWMARIEFFRRSWSAAALGVLGAFQVNRQGVPVSAIREALRRIDNGEVVGIFPEGEIKKGANSVLRGGAIKRGVCLLAAHSGRPVVPCLVVGTEKLNAVAPWLPFSRANLWVICGAPIEPTEPTEPTEPMETMVAGNPRVARQLMAERIEAAFVELYAELRTSFALEDSIVP